MTVSALKGAGIVELQRELAALDPKPAAPAAVTATAHGDHYTTTAKSPPTTGTGGDM